MSGLKIEPGDDGTEPLPGIEKAPPMSLRDALHKKFCEAGKGVVLYEVPDVVGLGSHNFCDAVAIGMWGSTGRRIHGIEVKASRSDWLRELRAVHKADRFLSQCDHWWLITTENGIANPSELPASWGWMSLKRHGLRVEKPAPELRPVPGDIGRLWAFALIRRAAEKDNAEVTRKVTAERERLQRQMVTEREYWESTRQDALSRLQKNVAEFEAASGITLSTYQGGRLGEIVAAIQNLDYSGLGGFIKRVQRDATSMDRVSKDLKSLAELLAKQFNMASTTKGDIDENR
jgi:hypothetical protein